MSIILDVVNNTTPSYGITVQNNEIDIDLTNATLVELTIVDAQTETVTNTGHKACSIVDADDGVIAYTPIVGDFPAEGRYKGEVKVTYVGGATQTLRDYIDIVIRDNFS